MFLPCSAAVSANDVLAYMLAADTKQFVDTFNAWSDKVVDPRYGYDPHDKERWAAVRAAFKRLDMDHDMEDNR
jgi:hypothetical protein